jgi:predicted nucleic acid-binding protein
LTLVLDANVVVGACITPHGFVPFEGEALVAPPIMWSEFRSSVHESVWRKETSSEDALRALARLDEGAVRVSNPRRLGAEAWRLADELGLAKTYDAEYLALARLIGCPFVTLDLRLYRGSRRLGHVFALEEWRASR